MTTLMRRLGLDQRSTISLAITGPRKTPHLNCLPSTVLARLPRRVPYQLDVKVLKMAVSLSDPRHPKVTLQILTTTLRSKTLKSMPSCSKASGVFSSRCRYPASSRESHFHRACLWDSSPVVTPFVRFGTSSVLAPLSKSVGLYLYPIIWILACSLYGVLLAKVPSVLPYPLSRT